MAASYPVPINLHSAVEAEAYRRHIRRTRQQPTIADNDQVGNRRAESDRVETVGPVEAARSDDQALVT